MYIYGCSLGGTVISHLLIKDPDHKFSGATAYGNPFDPARDTENFKTRACGLYDIVLGLSVNLKMRDTIKDIEKYSSKEQIESYRKGLNFFKDKTFRLTNIDTRIIAPMFGYKDSMAYYKAAVISG